MNSERGPGGCGTAFIGTCWLVAMLSPYTVYFGTLAMGFWLASWTSPERTWPWCLLIFVAGAFPVGVPGLTLSHAGLCFGMAAWRILRAARAVQGSNAEVVEGTAWRIAAAAASLVAAVPLAILIGLEGPGGW